MPGVLHARRPQARFCLAGNQATKTFAIKTASATTPAAKCWSPPRMEMARMRALYMGTDGGGGRARVVKRGGLRERGPIISLARAGVFVLQPGYRIAMSRRPWRTAFRPRRRIIYHAEGQRAQQNMPLALSFAPRKGPEIETATLIGCAGLMADRLVNAGRGPGFIICPLSAASTSSGPRHNRIVNHLICRSTIRQCVSRRPSYPHDRRQRYGQTGNAINWRLNAKGLP